MSRPVVLVLLMAIGFGAGMASARYLFPVEYVQTDLASLRVDFRTDLVLMTAERFHRDRDVQAALETLSAFGATPPVRMCEQALQFAGLASYSGRDLALLEDLLGSVREQAARSQPPGATP